MTVDELSSWPERKYQGQGFQVMMRSVGWVIVHQKMLEGANQGLLP